MEEDLSAPLPAWPGAGRTRPGTPPRARRAGGSMGHRASAQLFNAKYICSFNAKTETDGKIPFILMENRIVQCVSGWPHPSCWALDSATGAGNKVGMFDARCCEMVLMDILANDAHLKSS